MADNGKVGAVPLFVCWALIAAALVVRALVTASSVPLILDTDDAMRLTMVHDFLAGQAVPAHADYHVTRTVAFVRATATDGTADGTANGSHETPRGPRRRTGCGPRGSRACREGCFEAPMHCISWATGPSPSAFPALGHDVNEMWNDARLQ